MTMILDTSELIGPARPTAAKLPRESGPKRKAATDPAAGMARARSTIEKLEEQNHKAASLLQAMSNLWLSADANRRRSEAEMALNHFDDALIALRKSLAAT
jgi:hypothetical protein